jgi:hypothetical protein
MLDDRSCYDALFYEAVGSVASAGRPSRPVSLVKSLEAEGGVKAALLNSVTNICRRRSSPKVFAEGLKGEGILERQIGVASNREDLEYLYGSGSRPVRIDPNIDPSCKAVLES